MDFLDFVIVFMGVQRLNLPDLNRLLLLALINRVHPKTHRSDAVKESKMKVTNEYQTAACNSGVTINYIPSSDSESQGPVEHLKEVFYSLCYTGIEHRVTMQTLDVH